MFKMEYYNYIQLYYNLQLLCSLNNEVTNKLTRPRELDWGKKSYYFLHISNVPDFKLLPINLIVFFFGQHYYTTYIMCYVSYM